jgi:hypothetical protein
MLACASWSGVGGRFERGAAAWIDLRAARRASIIAAMSSSGIGGGRGAGGCGSGGVGGGSVPVGDLRVMRGVGSGGIGTGRGGTGVGAGCGCACVVAAGGAAGSTSIRRTFIATSGAEPAITSSGGFIFVSVKSAVCAMIDRASARTMRR